MAKKKYSAKERKAFHMRRAWAAGKGGKCISCSDEKTRQSFRNGVKITRARLLNGGKSFAQTASKKCDIPLYIVDGDGTIIKVLKGGAK